LRDDGDHDAWRAFFAAYDEVVLVANSEEAKSAGFDSLRSPKTLFIFFNDARRVIADRFDNDAVLVLRSGLAGPSVVRRKRLASVRDRFAAGRLKLMINMRTHAAERLMDPPSIDGFDVRTLDLSAYFLKRYTAGKNPSSGYALAVWLIENDMTRKVVLNGFSSLRSEQWRVFDSHDWALEQTALRLLERSGALRTVGTHEKRAGSIDALAAQFPDIDRVTLLSVFAEVGARRLEHSDLFIDRLWAATRVPRFFQRLLRRLR
jgi:hypothetical protein